MLSLVFLMQPLGQLCAYCVGLAVLHGLDKFGSYDLRADSGNTRVGIDVFWRTVVGVGGIPALFALFFRFTIPESGRYTCDIKRDAAQAVHDTKTGLERFFPGRSTRSSTRRSRNQIEAPEPRQVEAGLTEDRGYDGVEMTDFGGHHTDRQDRLEAMLPQPNQGDHIAPGGRPDEIEQESEPWPEAIVVYDPPDSRSPVVNGHPALPSDHLGDHRVDHHVDHRLAEEEEKGEEDSIDDLDEEEVAWSQFSSDELLKYFWDFGNWRYLFGACTCWFFLDVSLFAPTSHFQDFSC